jgi:hypothetical protein
VVHQSRDASGARRTVEIAEVVRGDDGPGTRRLCRWRPHAGGGFVWAPEAAAWLARLRTDCQRAAAP